MIPDLPPLPGPTPEGAQPHRHWSIDGCTYPGCGTEATVELSVAGRRCARHPAAFDPDRAAKLMADGWHDTALAYVRTDLSRSELPALPRPRDPLHLPTPLCPWPQETWVSP